METITLKDFLLREDQKIADAAQRREASRQAALQRDALRKMDEVILKNVKKN